MSQITIAVFKKALVLIIVLTVLLNFLALFFNFLSQTIWAIPVFYRHYFSLGLGVFVFKVVKEWLSE